MRWRALDRKFLRDLWRMKWQALAIALLIACGVAVTVMAFSAQKALKDAQDRFYENTRFGDVFAEARRAPLSRARDLARIDGVAAVDVRIAESGLMDVPGLTRPAVARVVSLPSDEAGGLNRLTLAGGRMPDPNRLDEAVAIKSFLDAAKVSLGDRLTTVIGGRTFSFRVAACWPSARRSPAMSPGCCRRAPVRWRSARRWSRSAIAMAWKRLSSSCRRMPCACARAWRPRSTTGAAARRCRPSSAASSRKASPRCRRWESRSSAS